MKYNIKPERRALLECSFSNHLNITDEQRKRYELLDKEGKRLLFSIVENSPASREQSLAITHLQEVIIWTKLAIVRHEIKYQITEKFQNENNHG